MKRVLAIMCVVLAAGCERHSGEELVIISPHSPEIRNEFSRGFSQWYRKKTGNETGIKWLDIGGTGESIEYIRSRNTGGAGGGVDLFFGGGNFPFVQLQREGLLAPHGVPDSILAVIPRTIGGTPVYQNDSLWYGAAISGFGILYNKEIVRRTGLRVPRTWEDLAARECRGWISSGDPRYSGSIHMMYEILLQAYGWERGWDCIARMGANIQGFVKGAGTAAKEVSTGQAALGLAIDFYAFIEIQRYGADRLGFILPEGQTVMSADGIAVLKNAPNPDLAGMFVNYVLSDGQKLWALKTGTPGGPAEYALCRFPVDSTIYGLSPEKLAITQNPFELRSTLQYNDRLAGRRWAILGDLIAAFIITPHRELVSCWKEIIRRGLTPAQYQSCFAIELSEGEVTRLLERWNSRDFALERVRLMNQWTRAAKKRYTSILNEQ